MNKNMKNPNDFTHEKIQAPKLFICLFPNFKLLL